RRDDDPGRPRSLRAPQHGAEVARVADLVETREERLRGGGELERVGVAERLAPRDDALVVARPGRLAEISLELRLDARPLHIAQPALGLERVLARPQLEHLARPAQRLTHGPPAVDELAAHFGTSWKPASTSRTRQPAASISSRSLSPSAKSFAARACCRCPASATTANARRSRSWSRHPCRIASASGVLKSSSRAASNAAQSPTGSLGERKT